MGRKPGEMSDCDKGLSSMKEGRREDADYSTFLRRFWKSLQEVLELKSPIR